MKNVINFLGAISGMSGISLLLFTVLALTHGKIVDQSLVDSQADKIFFSLMFGGCALSYIFTSVFLLKRWRLSDNTSALIAGLTSAYAFAAGLIYHVVLNSPW